MVNKEHEKKEKSEFTRIFEKFLKQSPIFPEILGIATRNSQGRIWIIGGFVYRPIIRHLYGEIPEPEIVDIDFMLEKQAEERDLYAPEGWDLKLTDYANPYLVKGKTRIDLNYLRNFHSIITRKLEPEMEHFFTGTPLDIQSIAYDFSEKKVIGQQGIDAIKRRLVKINNLEEAEYDAQIKKVSLEEFVIKKAKELGFQYDLTLLNQNQGNHHPEYTKR